MVLVLVVAVLAWWWLGEPAAGASTTPAPPAAATIGAGPLGPGEPIPPLERAITTTYRRGYEVLAPSAPRGRGNLW